MPALLTLLQVREIVQACVEDIASWCVGKPRLFNLPKPEQQLQFELAHRLREALRSRTENPTWDRLYYDGAAQAPATIAGSKARPPIFVDTRQLFGIVAAATRNPSEPDLALAVHVLRSSPAKLGIDENGNPAEQQWVPRSLLGEGTLLEERVVEFERLSRNNCDGALFVVYSNDARRFTAVDAREIASWASWQTPLDTLWWTVRHFRAKARP